MNTTCICNLHRYQQQYTARLPTPSSFVMADISIAAVNQDQCLAKTSSRCVTESVTATHDFEVTNFSLLNGMSTGKFVRSSTFSTGGRE
ncbi:hypothetical protein PR202_ga18983 [Eleusine coracana subsp. coracana]|uniref:Uncharacterized protein n=1 Tax=Eleusine coracana subsp. coracana TaxID=191504 RepID=A0AAV5CUS5_ELECO|nr:hypothetical protein PR202_ga18983 [Eleusine coracana subsp. coracana]